MDGFDGIDGIEDLDSDALAEELLESAAHTPGAEARLWRLEWAQVFKRLAEISRRDVGEGEPLGGGARLR